VEDGIEDFYPGNSNTRSYNEEMKQIYEEMLYKLEDDLKAN
jgi:hypothetical protein